MKKMIFDKDNLRTSFLEELLNTSKHASLRYQYINHLNGE